ncbi:MAG TPA: TIGR01777 family oxidoreductase [Candidatus Dormibacteraeota bacterium]|nr:TIGR01777 family oxidoreductase [Candidatus Dormibacteraeota bacterium]
MTGSTGLVGTALGAALAREGHTVCRLMRSESSRKEPSAGFDVAWDPATGELGGAAVGADAAVNLAGASIGGGRWTEKRKRLLLASRVETTRALVGAISKMAARPRVLLSASATGFYGNRGDEILTEESGPGGDFLASIAKEWEAEARKAEALGIRVVLLRFGIILANYGGALPPMMLPLRFGVGGRLGSGRQWMSWITLEDAIGAILLALKKESVSGALNIVAPQPLQNAAFTKALARAMHRPAIFAAPALALRLVLGREMADALLLGSQRAMPEKLQGCGYQFQYPALDGALHAILRD